MHTLEQQLDLEDDVPCHKLVSELVMSVSSSLITSSKHGKLQLVRFVGISWKIMANKSQISYQTVERACLNRSEA